jgi:HPt (histidine-containing phosphotransfer) domain-containing protein
MALAALLVAGVAGHVAFDRARRRRAPPLLRVAPPPQPLLDPSVKRSETVVKIFLKYAPGQVEALGRQLAAADATGLQAVAHKLRGSCLAIGGLRMAELCRALEAGDGDPSALYAELRAVFAEMHRQLAAELG